MRSKIGVNYKVKDVPLFTVLICGSGRKSDRRKALQKVILLPW